MSFKKLFIFIYILIQTSFTFSLAGECSIEAQRNLDKDAKAFIERVKSEQSSTLNEYLKSQNPDPNKVLDLIKKYEIDFLDYPVIYNANGSTSGRKLMGIDKNGHWLIAEPNGSFSISPNGYKYSLVQKTITDNSPVRVNSAEDALSKSSGIYDVVGSNSKISLVSQTDPSKVFTVDHYDVLRVDYNRQQVTVSKMINGKQVISDISLSDFNRRKWSLPQDLVQAKKNQIEFKQNENIQFEKSGQKISGSIVEFYSDGSILVKTPTGFEIITKNQISKNGQFNQVNVVEPPSRPIEKSYTPQYQQISNMYVSPSGSRLPVKAESMKNFTKIVSDRMKNAEFPLDEKTKHSIQNDIPKGTREKFFRKLGEVFYDYTDKDINNYGQIRSQMINDGAGAATIMLNQKGVCRESSVAMQAVLADYGVETYVRTGNSRNPGYDGRHAWLETTNGEVMNGNWGNSTQDNQGYFSSAQGYYDKTGYKPDSRQQFFKPK